MSIRINGKKYINGTVVRANPVEEVTGTLKKIGIGSDVYEIQGSGGGSGYDVNDYYLQDGQISDGGNRQFLTAYYDKPLVTGKNYIINFKNSVDGTVVGTAVFKYTSDFTTTMAGGGSIGTITMIITSTSITSNNYTGSWQNIYVDVYREISSADFYHPVIYSTEEREIGVWTDNKPLYQKTIITNNSTVNSDVTISISSLNMETLVKISGEYSRVATWASLRFVYPFNVYEQSSYHSYLRFGDTNDEIQYGIYLGANETSDYQAFTLQYTKTTDVAGSGSYNTLGVPTVHYTTDEQVIGTWVDGKPLYERSYSFTNTRSSFTDYVTLYNIPNIETVVKNTFTALRDLGQNEKLHYTGEGTARPEHDTSYYINVREYNGNIQYRINGYGTQITEMVITTQYTKTTD